MKTALFLVSLLFFFNTNAQTFTLTSPENFTLGCGTKSVCTININPPPSTYTLTGPPASSIIVYGTPGSQGSSTLNFAGTWTMSASNGTSQVQIPFSILQNTFAPDVTVSMQTQTLTCSISSITLNAGSNTPSATFSWSSSGSSSIITASAIPVNTIIGATSTLVNTFTLIVTDPDNTCTSQTVIPVYQNVSSPTLNVSNAFNCPNPTIDIYLDILSFGPNLTFSWSVPPNANVSGIQNATLTTNMTGTYTLMVTDNSNDCSSNAEITVEEGCVGILKNKKDSKESSVFPNPTSGSINIQTTNFSEKTKIEIYDNLGRLLLRQNMESENSFLDLMSIGQGMYTLLLIENGEIRSTFKLIKTLNQ